MTFTIQIGGDLNKAKTVHALMMSAVGDNVYASVATPHKVELVVRTLSWNRLAVLLARLEKVQADQGVEIVLH